MSIKVKKRITPTLISKLDAPIAKSALEDEEDRGPIGPRRQKRIKAGPKLSKALAILKEPKHKHEHPWVHHVKLFAEKHNMSYGCALSDPTIKSGYKKGKFTLPTSVTPKEPKKRKAGGESSEAKKHIKFLNKLAGGNYEDQVAKRRKERMEGGGISSSFLAELEKKAGGGDYGKKYKGF
jgi:hypothetical protein